MIEDGEIEAIFRAETTILFGEADVRLLAVERACRVLEQEWRALLGLVHTIKGNCGMVGRDVAESACHELERRAREIREWPLARQADGAAELLRELDRVRLDALGAPPAATPAPANDSAARGPAGDGAARTPSVGTVAAARLDELLDATDDVVTMLERLAALPRASRTPAAAATPAALAELSHAATRSVRTLRHSVMQLRLVPLRSLLGRYVRPLHDLARQHGKQIDVQLEVGELAVDREIADRLGEPLLHVLRNAVVHGVEPASERVRAGKVERATVSVHAELAAGRITLSIRDDGRGIDVAALREAAERLGRDTRGIDRAALLDLVFAAELSTSRETTLAAGRGVGLDQSRRAIEAVGGTIAVHSEPGAGTELRMRVPLALAMQRALVVRRADVRYAVPFRATIEVARWHGDSDGHRDRGTIRWRDRTLALVAPADGFRAGPGDPRTGVIVTCKDDVAAIAVDEVLGYQDVTIRRLDAVFGRPRGISGAAVALDGGVVLVLDPDALDRAAAREAA